MATIKTPEAFVHEYNGKAVNSGKGWDDSKYGYQCVAGFKTGCEWLGIPVMPTPNNWADGYWTCLNSNGTPNTATEQWQRTYFDKIRDPQDFRNGDWVIWGRNGQSPSHPSSHVALWFNDQEFGENQGGTGAFCLKQTIFTDALGALRPKAWEKIQPFESTKTINGRSYSLYGQGAGLQPVILSPGLNQVAKIQSLDCDRWIYLKITGCNLFQNDKNNPAGQPYGMTFGPISSSISDVYQTLPDQDSTMFFDLETGEHADCTGVTINPDHNVFSPSLIYQPGKNVQYARMVGLSQRNIVSRYTFLIRYTDGTYAAGLTDQDETPEDIWADFQSLAGLESLSILDGGESAQMMRYISKENRIEYTRTTTRPTAGCVAFVGGPVQAPEQPQEPDAPTDSNENEKDEETTMPEEKPQETPEMSPVEGWTDPEPGAGTTILERISALLSVKSIITLAFVGTYLAMVLQGQTVPSLFENILTMIVSFFFGYQFKKAEK